MIHRTETIKLTESWQNELSQLITTPEALFDYLKLDHKLLEDARKAHALFPIRITHSYANKIEKGNTNDPLLKQILPLGEELEDVKGYSDDPLNEREVNHHPGLVHKYYGRVLFITAPQCAINCRYCFRRQFDYKSNTPSRNQWQSAIDYIAQDKTIEEVILSGGDPLVLPDNQLEWIVNKLSEIEHLLRLRIHSRLPIVLPSRITTKVSKLLTRSRLETVFVVHCNHSQEIDKQVKEALARLSHSGMSLLNQSVLLKDINDEAQILVDLSKSLFSSGVMPYYLHLLDKVSGSAHFDVSEAKAKRLYQDLLTQLPGYLVPKLVREVPSAPSKIPVV